MEALYSKYRPNNFAEVIGQPTIVSILSRQIATKTFKQTYMFAGPTGVGKTSTARIFAYEVNNKEGNAIEIDAASNNGVDNIRQLIIDAQQTSLDSEYKVYIIDECHQLTRAAWDAALKLIEEPPLNSIFIFCTTNPAKVPETILNRLQRFDFKRVSTKDISDRLEYILNEEFDDINYTKSALDKIAYKSNGFVREAISLLDKCLSYSKEVIDENVDKALGFTKTDVLSDLLNSLANKNYSEAVKIVDTIKLSNSNILNVLDEIIRFIVEAAKIQKFGKVIYSFIPQPFQANILNYKVNLIDIVDRFIKFRLMAQTIEADTLLNVILLDICGGNNGR